MARDTHDRMLKATAGLLQARGFHGTALNDVLDASGAPRGSLYFHFPDGKAQLAFEATQDAVERLTAARSEAYAGAATPGDAIRAIAREIADTVEASDYLGGCPISPLVLDGDTMSVPLADLCRDTFAAWTDALRQGMAAAGISPEAAEGLALLALSTFQGSLILARAARDSSPILVAAEQVALAVERATPSERER